MTASADTAKRTRLVVLISGSGSNLQAIIDAQQSAFYPAEIVAVISNKAGVKGLQRAESAGIPTRVLSHQSFDSRESYDSELAALIDSYTPDIIALAGFMRILTPGFVEKYQGRMLNIHPSLLPAHKGLDTHQQVLDAAETRHGATVHFVTADLDSGPLIIQAELSVENADNAETLAARVLEKEHVIYPLAIAWLAQGLVEISENRVKFAEKILESPVRLTFQ